MNWVDFIFIIILAGTAAAGIIRGFVRQVIGLAAVILGFVLAALYYEGTAEVFAKFIHDRLVSNFLGFLAIFFAVLAAGALLGFLVSKVMKGPLALANRALGGLFGLVTAVLICGVIAFALAAFHVAPTALGESRLAPFCVGVTKAAVNLVPQDLKDKFIRSYQEIRRSGGKGGGKDGEKI
ncbi:MAG TPA: CvpA family protein [Terriglobales bacterium]|nr:CvpA family protein [Terriglobales bacterium]